MARGQPDRPVRRTARNGRPGTRARAARRTARLEPAPGRRGLDLPGLARRTRRPRRHAGTAGHLPRGVRPGRRAGPGLDRGRGTARAYPDRLRHGGAAAALPPPDQGRGGTVVPGLLRTRRRIRPGRGGHPCGPAGRGVGDHRREGVDVAGPPGRLVLRAGPDRIRLPAPKGPVLPAGPDAPAGGHGAPDQAADGTSEFNEVFFDGARTAAANVVGEPGDGWRIAKATLAIERGAAMPRSGNS